MGPNDDNRSVYAGESFQFADALMEAGGNQCAHARDTFRKRVMVISRRALANSDDGHDHERVVQLARASAAGAGTSWHSER